MSKAEKGGFDIPTQSLAKIEPKEGSAAWMKEASREHGDTGPQKLEKRRDRLSHLVLLMEKGLKQLQAVKKSFIAKNAKERSEIRAAAKTPSQLAVVDSQLAEMKSVEEQMIQQYDMLIDQKISNMALVEGQCLIVDCMSLREKVKSKGGKVGYVRFSSALYNCDAAWYAGKTSRKLKKVYDAMLALNPMLAGALKDDEDKEDEEEDDTATEYDDEDVVDESDRKKTKDEIEGVDFE